jgi:S-adenosylmethionine:tRNA ribosyltransferase-isomerase
VRLSDFDYDLPPERIAQAPLPARDASRLLVVHRDRGALGHHSFRDLPGLLRAGDRLVVNDTRVVPARLLGRRRARPAWWNSCSIRWRARVGDAGDRRSSGHGATAAGSLREQVVLVTSEIREVVGRIDDRKRQVRFPEGFRLREFLDRKGHCLPPTSAGRTAS